MEKQVPNSTNQSNDDGTKSSSSPDNPAIRGLRRARAQKARRQLETYRQDPAGYAKDILEASLTEDQISILISVRDNRYTAVKASHAIGKTFSAAVAANWWYDCWSEHIVYITAPTWSQALGLTFKEIKMFRRELRLPGVILETGLVRDRNKSREGRHFIRALNAESGEGFQGEHSAPILIILEEAVGVPMYIWEAAGGLMTHPDNRLLAIANPTDDANMFGQVCEKPGYNVMSVSALDHPNIKAELECKEPPYPKAVRLQWLYEMLDNECESVPALTHDAFQFYSLDAIKAALEGRSVTEESAKTIYQPTAYFQGRVLGEFPTQADQQVIPKGWLRSQEPLNWLDSDPPEIGCDTARFGDDRTTIVGRRGPCVLSLEELRKMDSNVVADRVRETAARLCEGTIYEPKRVLIKMDVTGGMGTGPCDILTESGYRIIPINSSNRANDQEQYPNVRSELWFDQRARVKEKRLDLSRLPKGIREKLIRELATPKYSVRSGKKVVEEKADIKKRLGVSPDLADGVNLAFYSPSIPSIIAFSGTFT